MKPYYQDSLITLYHADCGHILPLLGDFDLLMADPPYGIGADKNTRANKRHGKAVCASTDYGIGNWDDQIIDRWLIELARSKCKKQIIFGGNYYELPKTKCWIVWDKINGENGYADFEMAWTNLDIACRKIDHQWHGMIRKGNEPRFHPTQKPLDVIQRSIEIAGEGIASVLDPWSGSGTTGVACKNLGKQCVLVEKDERFCEVAARRLSQEVLPLFSDPISKHEDQDLALS